MNRKFLLYALCFVSCVLVSCAERKMIINSDPQGAKVYVDGQEQGITPAYIPFVYYGSREIVLQKDGYQTRRYIEPIKPPLVHVFPFDLLMLLLPYPLSSEYEFNYPLRKSEKTDVKKVWSDALELKEYLRKRLPNPPGEDQEKSPRSESENQEAAE